MAVDALSLNAPSRGSPGKALPRWTTERTCKERYHNGNSRTNLNRWAGVRASLVTAHLGLTAVTPGTGYHGLPAGRHQQPPGGPWILMRLTRARGFSHG